MVSDPGLLRHGQKSLCVGVAAVWQHPLQTDGCPSVHRCLCPPQHPAQQNTRLTAGTRTSLLPGTLWRSIVQKISSLFLTQHKFKIVPRTDDQFDHRGAGRGQTFRGCLKLIPRQHISDLFLRGDHAAGNQFNRFCKLLAGAGDAADEMDLLQYDTVHTEEDHEWYGVADYDNFLARLDRVNAGD